MLVYHDATGRGHSLIVAAISNCLFAAKIVVCVLIASCALLSCGRESPRAKRSEPCTVRFAFTIKGESMLFDRKMVDEYNKDSESITNLLIKWAISGGDPSGPRPVIVSQRSNLYLMCDVHLEVSRKNNDHKRVFALDPREGESNDISFQIEAFSEITLYVSNERQGFEQGKYCTISTIRDHGDSKIHAFITIENSTVTTCVLNE